MVTFSFQKLAGTEQYGDCAISRSLYIGLVLGLANRLLGVSRRTGGKRHGISGGVCHGGRCFGSRDAGRDSGFRTITHDVGDPAVFSVDGHHLVLLALGSSFQLIPPFGAHLRGPCWIING